MSMAQRLSSSIMNARSLSMLGALSTGNAGPLAGSVVWNLLGSPGNATRSGTGLLGRLTGTAGTAAEDLGGIAAPAALEAPAAIGATAMIPVIGAVVAGFLATAAGAEFLRQGQTQARKYQLGLANTIGGITNPSHQLNGIWSEVRGVGQEFNVDPNVAYDTARQLGTAGITDQPGAHGLKAALGTTLAFATQSNIDPSQAANLTSTLMVKGGQSAETVAQMFQVLAKQAALTNIPIAKMIDSFTTLEQITGGVNTSLAGVYGLAALQKAFGSATNVGQGMAPAMGAGGFQAITTAGILGVPLKTFENAQSNSAAMADLTAAWLQRQPGFGGKNTSDATLQAYSTVLQNTGLYDFTGVSDANRLQIMHGFANDAPGGFQAAAAKAARDKRMKLESMASYIIQGAKLSGDVTSDTSKAKLTIQYALAGLANQGTNLYNTIGGGNLGNAMNSGVNSGPEVPNLKKTLTHLSPKEIFGGAAAVAAIPVLGPGIAAAFLAAEGARAAAPHIADGVGQALHFLSAGDSYTPGRTIPQSTLLSPFNTPISTTSEGGTTTLAGTTNTINIDVSGTIHVDSKGIGVGHVVRQPGGARTHGPGGRSKFAIVPN
jgi:hypothetical protein